MSARRLRRRRLSSIYTPKLEKGKTALRVDLRAHDGQAGRLGQRSTDHLCVKVVHQLLLGRAVWNTADVEATRLPCQRVVHGLGRRRVNRRSGHSRGHQTRSTCGAGQGQSKWGVVHKLLSEPETTQGSRTGEQHGSISC